MQHAWHMAGPQYIPTDLSVFPNLDGYQGISQMWERNVKVEQRSIVGRESTGSGRHK
jgi:hypothetical protein